MVELKQSGILENFKMPVREECDVAVAGGGAAGVLAALAAAGNGARTVLIEQNTFLGGSLLGESGAWKGFHDVKLVRGITDTIITRLIERQGSTGFYEERVNTSKGALRIHGDREQMPQLFLEMLKESGVILYLNSMVVDAIKEENAVKGIIMAGKYGREAILAKTIIDATGSGCVAEKAGAGILYNEDRQSAGIAFGLGRLDLDCIKTFAEEKGILTSLGYADKYGLHKDTDAEHRDNITRLGFKINELDEFTQYTQGYCRLSEICITSNHEGRATQLGGIVMKLDTLDVLEISKAYVKLNKLCFELAASLKKYIPGFENSFVDWTSPYLSIDYGRTVECIYDVSKEDMTLGRIPEDTIGSIGATGTNGVFGTDGLIPEKNEGTEGGFYGLPYRAILPKGVENLLVIGRMISSDIEVQQTTGSTGGSFLQGQAAGTAAAIAAGSGCTVSRIDTCELRKKLLAIK